MKSGFLALAAAVLAAQPAIAQTSAPDEVRALKLSEVILHPDERGPDASGTLPGGVRVELDYHRDGRLEEVEAKDRDLLPFEAVAPVLPEPMRADARLAGAGLEQIEFDDDGIEIEGRDRDGNRFKAEYSASGALQDWKRD
ncbi:hypothetical protein [Paracoccus ravus]|uniref:hypothetical protein n=1 Tax=Paracoccus ravus TaxID=2447760 RepID=UPI00106E6AC4|nr:hypothetical protein [Paracoccus ravus]